MSAHGLLAPVGGLLVGLLANYALWRGSPDLSNLAIWRGRADPPTDPSPARTAALAALLAVLLVGGLVLALGVQQVAGVAVLPVVFAVAAAAFAVVAAVDFRAGRTRAAAFYLIAALLWVTILLDWVVEPGTTAGQTALDAATFAVLGYFVMDVLDVGLPDRATPE